MAYFSALGLGGTALPTILWEQQQETGEITKEMLANAEAVVGLESTDEERELMLSGHRHRAVRRRCLRDTLVRP